MQAEDKRGARVAAPEGAGVRRVTGAGRYRLWTLPLCEEKSKGALIQDSKVIRVCFP